MSRSKLIAAVSLAVALITMLTLNQLPIYASATTEDDGWVEGDYDGSSEEQEEQAQEDWEDAGRPGETDDDDNENDDDDNDNDNNAISRSYESPASANTPGLTVQNTAVNETRWYNNCMGGGKQYGGGLQFNIFSYQTCGQNANGDKAYYDGFVQGCDGIHDAKYTKELCESFVVECLRAQGPEVVAYNSDCTASSLGQSWYKILENQKPTVTQSADGIQQKFDSTESNQLVLSTKNKTNITTIININEQSILDGAHPHDAWFTINGERYENGSYYDMDDWVYPSPPEPDGMNTEPLERTLVIPDNQHVEICLVDKSDYESCQLVTNNSEIVRFLYP